MAPLFTSGVASGALRQRGKNRISVNTWGLALSLQLNHTKNLQMQIDAEQMKACWCGWWDVKSSLPSPAEFAMKTRFTQTACPVCVYLGLGITQWRRQDLEHLICGRGMIWDDVSMHSCWHFPGASLQYTTLSEYIFMYFRSHSMPVFSVAIPCPTNSRNLDSIAWLIYRLSFTKPKTADKTHEGRRGFLFTPGRLVCWHLLTVCYN